ncbi:MAG: hypothetical protein IJI36_03890 [Kiritimatiellae bacterium]|nr:hypothetical protein [Kiritimatiellia bacterium]
MSRHTSRACQAAAGALPRTGLTTSHSSLKNAAGAREVFAQAVQWQASSIIVAHNHPSGDPTPSGKDIELTKELLAASKVLHIPLLDHLIIGSPESGTGFISLRTDGFVKFEG